MSRKKIVIIIPTHNESLSLSCTVKSLQNVIADISHCNIQILIFDSASTDETINIASSLREKYANVHLVLESKKSGLGSAYIQAMGYAIDEMAADIVFEYDADGSHQPKYLPAMIDLFNQGADVVVGSRYVKGGSVDSCWPWQRHLTSKLGNLVTQLFLTFRYKDFTSGFRGTKSCYLSSFLNKKLLSKRYAYKIQLFWDLHKQGAKIVEHPVHFIDRSKGESKAPNGNIKESLLLVITLRLLEMRRYFSMCMAGFLVMIVQIIAFDFMSKFFSL
ncbi:glycosyltransferase [Piscirickettsia litoralis]|uniref:Glycosyltransferase 2-like domain-containing protein n=1 Tax=Piscirickettsia litoralis TaxID=1891921 RepID=A0ABX2ZZL3_9GAMM|nr:glycosyltransferase [Piscirickettsia litoralis]ODN42046.1 hypothetical protein BGC07_02595 [Piscirickettsia litoralis]